MNAFSLLVLPVLLAIAIIAIQKIFLAFAPWLGRLRVRLYERLERNKTPNWLDEYADDLKKKEKDIPLAEQPYRSGACELCGKEFLRETSTPKNRLYDVVYEFYGKKRKKLVCAKCLANLRKDKGVKICK